MLEVPESCPKIALKAETKMLSMKHRIWQMKLMLLRRIQRQGQDTLCGMILKEQREKEWPGLTKEVSELCEKLEIPDLNHHILEDSQIKKAIVNHNLSEVKREVAGSKKMEKHANDNFDNIQPYMKGKSVHQTRMCFRVRCEMVKDVKGNFKSKYKREGGEQNLICKECDIGQVETQSHCTICPKWENIRSDLDLTTINDLATFFQRLLAERSKDKNGSDRAALLDSVT